MQEGDWVEISDGREGKVLATFMHEWYIIKLYDGYVTMESIECVTKKSAKGGYYK